MKELLVNVEEEKKTIVLIENGIILEKYDEYENDSRLEGNIYLGKVQNVLSGLQAAFVDIGRNKNAFIYVKDILPKIDEKEEDISKIVNQDIRKVVKQGEFLLVQIKKDSSNKKGARVSTHINLPGRYCVLLPNTPFITASQKIDSGEEKQRLTKILKEILPKGYGAIIRTSAVEKSKEVIEEDVKQLIEKWNEIQEKSKLLVNDMPQLLHKNYDIVEKILLDLVDQNLEKVVVNGEEIYKEIEQIINKSNMDIKLELRKENLLEMYDIKKQLEKIENRKVWLKCGGFITIDKTEALTAIDVNSGKYTGNKNLEDTVFEVNKEASIEIAKQLRLRDIGGIIIIDYIDMQKEENKKKIISILQEQLKKDRTKTQIVGFSKLNLLEMTRKHIYSSN